MFKSCFQRWRLLTKGFSDPRLPPLEVPITSDLKATPQRSWDGLESWRWRPGWLVFGCFWPGWMGFSGYNGYMSYGILGRKAWDFRIKECHNIANFAQKILRLVLPCAECFLQPWPMPSWQSLRGFHTLFAIIVSEVRKNQIWCRDGHESKLGREAEKRKLCRISSLRKWSKLWGSNCHSLTCKFRKATVGFKVCGVLTLFKFYGNSLRPQGFFLARGRSTWNWQRQWRPVEPVGLTGEAVSLSLRGCDHKEEKPQNPAKTKHIRQIDGSSAFSQLGRWHFSLRRPNSWIAFWRWAGCKSASAPPIACHAAKLMATASLGHFSAESHTRFVWTSPMSCHFLGGSCFWDVVGFINMVLGPIPGTLMTWKAFEKDYNRVVTNPNKEVP